jgi:flagellar basal-body rod protein FlgC
MILNRAVRIAASGLTMQRARMELVASNLANVNTTRTSQGGPYQRQLPLVRATGTQTAGFETGLASALRQVEVYDVRTDSRPPLMKFEPGHPDADARGYVAYPNIDPIEETVDMVSALRSYEANVNVIKQVRRMNDAALQLVRG